MKALVKAVLPRLWYARGRIPLLNFPIPWRLPYGKHVFLVYPDEMGYNVLGAQFGGRTYEEGEWRFLVRFIRPGWCCFDIGANQGFFTVLLSKRTGAEGTVIAFEPVGSELRKLRTNLWLNRCSNVVPEPMAVGSYDGVAEMIICRDGHGSRSSMGPQPEDVRARTAVERVRVTSLDSYVHRRGVSRVDFMKVDVEGAEREVLKGAMTILTSLRPVVMLELNDRATRQLGYSAAENFEMLESNGYTLYRPTRAGGLARAFREIKQEWGENLIAVPSESVDSVGEFVSGRP